MNIEEQIAEVVCGSGDDDPGHEFDVLNVQEEGGLVQRILDLLRKNDWVELDNDQSLPPALYQDGDAFTEEAVKSDMVRDGFRRVSGARNR